MSQSNTSVLVSSLAKKGVAGIPEMFINAALVLSVLGMAGSGLYPNELAEIRGEIQH